MADILAAVVSAAQAAEYCLKLCDLLDRLYHASETSRKHQERVLELVPLLQQIRQDPTFDTPEISSCTRSLAAILEPLTFPKQYKTRSPRFLNSIVFIIREKRFGRIFESIEEKKSTLTLYITNTTLKEVRIGLRHSPRPGEALAMSPSPADIAGQEGQAGQRSPRDQPNQSQDSAGKEMILAPKNDLMQTPLTSNYAGDTARESSDGFSPQGARSPSPADFVGNEISGSGTMHNGHKVGTDTTPEEMIRMSKKFYGNTIRAEMEAVPQGSDETQPLPNNMHNGTEFLNNVRPVAGKSQYGKNVIYGKGNMHNGDSW